MDGEAIFGLNGPKHIVKNVVGNLRSAARAVYFGRFWADFSAALDLKLPPDPFQGYDPQSDKEAALFLNPYFLITELCSSVSDVRVPWSLTGAMLIDLLLTLATTAVLHPEAE